MGMRIDEAGRHDEVAGVDDLARAVLDFADFGDASAADCDVGLKARRAGAVNHGAVADQKIIRHASVLLLACLLPNGSSSQVDGLRAGHPASPRALESRPTGVPETSTRKLFWRAKCHLDTLPVGF